MAELIVYVVGVAVLAVLGVVLTPLKIEAKAWVMQRRKVSEDKIAEVVLAEVQKDRNPTVEVLRASAAVIRAWRSGKDS